tara:strand:+ start:613 stop:1107 length:495 start_codon:yes stop_codon:yes gene_type:complete
MKSIAYMYIIFILFGAYKVHNETERRRNTVKEETVYNENNILVKTHFTQQDKKIIDTMAKLIWSECGICEIQERDSIAQVIVNRVHSERWSNSYMEVMLQPNQFHGMMTNNHDYDTDTYNIAKRRYLINKKTAVQFFMSNNPHWIDTLKGVPVDGNFHHKFYSY